jgi:hypothetical protein
LAIAIIVVETSDFVDVGKKLGFNGRSEVRGQIADVKASLKQRRRSWDLTSAI